MSSFASSSSSSSSSKRKRDPSSYEDEHITCQKPQTKNSFGNSFVRRLKGAFDRNSFVRNLKGAFINNHKRKRDSFASSSSSSSSKRKRDFSLYKEDEPVTCKKPKNDVFVNYSFEDIGNSFVRHLKGDLDRNCFTVIDHTTLPVGQDLCSELLKAIEESEISIVVFSRNYASSVRSLDELVCIMDCYHRLAGRRVLPVFYKVDPHDVRSQQAGPFMESFRAHEINEDRDMVRKWKETLKEAGQLSGLTLQQNGDEAKFVSEIVEEVKQMQSPQELHVTEYPVGLRSRAEELISTLRLDSTSEVLVVAVTGFSGIGKTAIVKEAFNLIASKFDFSCFLADIYNLCQVSNWKVVLPKELISCLTRGSIMANHNDGVTKIQRLVKGRKILLVLDDIENFQQLEAIGINPVWFYKGSRIIVTTRDKRSLGNIPYASYRVRLLNRRESLNLFTRLMFSPVHPCNTKFIEEVVSRAGGLPLVIKVWSSHFQQHKREEWPNILETLKRIPHGDIHKQLKMSYDSLTNRAKKLFLDLACFFNGYEKDLVVIALQDPDSAFFPNIELQYLLDKSLVEIIEFGRVTMHHAIREMGEEIVRQENEDEPGQRTRLCDETDVIRVLTECSGTGLVESIKLLSSSHYENVTVQSKALSKMNNLRLISFRAKLSFGKFQDDDEVPTFCFKKLKLMEWMWFPFKSLDNIEMGNLVVLRLYESKLEILWEGIKFLKKLRILDVSGSSSLTQTGDFYGLENLEELFFDGCKNLKELHGSIVRLHKLVSLNLEGCVRLKRIPWEAIVTIPSLRDLSIGFGHSYVSYAIPDVEEFISSFVSPFKSHIGSLTNLTRLCASGCGLSQLPNEIGNLVSLKELDLSYNLFISLPDSLSNLSQLVILNIFNCSKLKLLPLLPSNLEDINAFRCDSLDIMPFDSMLSSYIFRTKVGKESLFTKQLSIVTSSPEELLNWCSYKSSGKVLSFMTPMQLDKNICGILLYAHSGVRDSLSLHNVTKNTRHFLREFYCDGIKFYPLDVITLVVEAGDLLKLEFHKDSYFGFRLRLIYDTEVFDSGLVMPDVEPNPPIPSEMTDIGNAQLNDIPVDSSDGYTSASRASFSDYDSDDGHNSERDDAYRSIGDDEDELL